MKVKVQKSKVKTGILELGTRHGSWLRTSSPPDSERRTPVPGPRSPVSRPLKVLHVIPSVGPLRGGPSQAVQTFACGLAAAGVEVHVATTDDNGSDRLAVPYGKPVVVQGVSYWYFPRQSRLYTVSLPLSRWLARHIADYDLVHIHALFSHASLAAAFWSRWHRVPYLIRPAGLLNQWGMRNRRPWLKRLAFRAIDRQILAGAAVLHYTSEQERQEATILGIEGRHVVIPNPVTVPPAHLSELACRFRARYPQLEGKVVMLFLSRFDVKKGLDLLLPAFAAARAHYPELMFVLAGNGEPPYVARLQVEAERLGVSPGLVWPGFLAGEEKWAALAAADGFVLPSYSENFAIAVVEAMAVGCPVVISDHVGIHPDVTTARAGIVTPCDSQALSHALTVLAGDREMRAQMGRNGQTLARTNFSLKAVTNSLLRLYKNICHAEV